jgi:hypothetical protein
MPFKLRGHKQDIGWFITSGLALLSMFYVVLQSSDRLLLALAQALGSYNQHWTRAGWHKEFVELEHGITKRNRADREGKRGRKALRYECGVSEAVLTDQNQKKFAPPK